MLAPLLYIYIYIYVLDYGAPLVLGPWAAAHISPYVNPALLVVYFHSVCCGLLEQNLVGPAVLCLLITPGYC